MVNKLSTGLLLSVLLVLNSGVVFPNIADANAVSVNSSTTTAGTSNINTPKLKVVASFFPVYEFVKKVGGDKVDSSVLVPIGAEPHDFDPTIQQIQGAESAAMLVYNGAGMDATWINKVNPKFAVDTSNGLNLLASHDSEIHAPTDPHIWLDPVLAIHQVENIRNGLSKVDPGNAAYYDQNAQNFIGQLKSLDASIRSNLSSSNCAKRDFIAFHNAFGYFAKEYGLNQRSIHEGLTPEGEILPQRLVEVVQLAKNLGINIIYSEDLIDPRSAQVIADEIPNGKVMVLSPIEGINKQEQQQGIGYLEKMYQDLAALKEGLQCKN
ncbi:MAG TPA: zinc ABC transporter substrate-binding protein [Nitrososphaeraceae archaeon]|nr:zinc ABC transporter substrate-binding protein [Nitrososphaeraceae archaeon]